MLKRALCFTFILAVSSLFLCFAETLNANYYLIISTAVTKGQKEAVISDVVTVKIDEKFSASTGKSDEAENQFDDFMKGSAGDFTKTASFNFHTNCLGPYKSKNEAQIARREEIGKMKSGKYIVYDLTTGSLPRFVYYQKD